MVGPFHRAAIAEGVSFAAVQDTKFKHNRLSVSMLMPLEEGKLSERAIVPYILRQGTRKYPDFTRLNERLSDLYGAALEANVDKFGSYQLLNLGMVGIDSRFAFDGEDMVKELANLLADILLDPYVENGAFSSKETELEKEYLKDTIEAEINDKRSYALMRCRSIMCQGEALALRKLGTIEEVEAKFGKRVRELVESETEDKRADLPPSSTWRIRKEESLEVLKNTDDIAVLIVWLGDKLANMRSIYRDHKTEGVQMWQKFNQKNVDEQAWYYRSIVTLTERLSNTSAWLEYKTLTELVFGKGE